MKLRPYHEAGVRAADGASWTSRGKSAAVTGQNVLTGSLEVKGPAVEGVVVRVAKDGADARFCTDREGDMLNIKDSRLMFLMFLKTQNLLPLPGQSLTTSL